MDAPAFDFDQADRVAACIHVQLAGKVGTIARGAQVRSAGRVGRVVTFRCDGQGRPAAWVDFRLPTGDLVSLLVAVSELERL